jgi:hypothetical protein
MKCKNVLPKSALSCAVENFVGTNSEGRNGPLGIEFLRAEEKGQLAPTLFLAFDCEPAFAGIAGTILPMATLSPFAAVGKSSDKQEPCSQPQPKRLSCTA